MYTILIADPDLYAVGIFKTKEEAQEDIKKMKLPEDSLVIEITERIIHKNKNTRPNHYWSSGRTSSFKLE